MLPGLGRAIKKIIIFPDERSLEQYRNSTNQMDVTTVKLHTSQLTGRNGSIWQNATTKKITETTKKKTQHTAPVRPGQVGLGKATIRL